MALIKDTKHFLDFFNARTPPNLLNKNKAHIYQMCIFITGGWCFFLQAFGANSQRVDNANADIAYRIWILTLKIHALISTDLPPFFVFASRMCLPHILRTWVRPQSPECTARAEDTTRGECAVVFHPSPRQLTCIWKGAGITGRLGSLNPAHTWTHSDTKKN